MSSWPSLSPLPVTQSIIFVCFLFLFLFISAAGMDSLIPGLDPLQTDPGSAALPGQQFCKYAPILYHTADVNMFPVNGYGLEQTLYSKYNTLVQTSAEAAH